ncbi:MAG: SHOCT domain-containing protein [Nanoarchaeota archaeon]
MKKTSIIFLCILLFSTITIANENFDEAVKLIESKTPCSELTEDQLEMMGDYYMEQMHPGELHEIMDARMGGEDSAQLKQVHINMAKMFYCGQSNVMPMGMINMMMNRGGSNMMGFYGSPYGYWGFGSFGMVMVILFWLVIIWLVVRAIRQFTMHKESSLDVLEKRFAKGEISKKEYLEMKKELRK